MTITYYTHTHHTTVDVIILQAQAQIQAQALAQQTKAQSSKDEGQAASQQQQQTQPKTAESADVKSSEDDDSSLQLHRKVVQSGASELEPVNLPQVHHHQPLAQTTSAPYGRNRLGETLSESEEPSEYLLKKLCVAWERG